MECTIMVFGEWATLRDWNWTSSSAEVAELLNSMLDPNGQSPSDPQPAINEAHRVADLLGGEVVNEKKQTGEPGVIY